ncbi:MAG: alanyl-tRNA editing protein [Nanoarchaeota archaeon]|nr:alanyl-tRNA editing protein [Nanoarchaeota archaeon]
MNSAYLNDAYTHTFTTTVERVEANQVFLATTYFYPTGGGQPCDLGTITHNNTIYTVIDVQKNESTIIHTLDKQGLQPGDIVTCTIDWKRRYQLMKMHTAIHLLGAVFEHEAGTQTTGNQIGLEESRVDSNFPVFTKELIQTYIDQANILLKKNLPVTTYFVETKKALEDPTLFKLAAGFKHTNLEHLRIVAIGDYDKQADGGTHVNNTSEIGTIILKGTESKGKERKRVYFSLAP